jgi:hypothetical protein
MTMIKQFRLRWIFFALLIFASASPAWAWIDTGHRLVAMIAWADLTPAARTKYVNILKQHPRYNEDLLADLPKDSDPDVYSFGIAATWPDIVRSLSNPMHAAYNHQPWHYVDIPYSIGGQAVNLPVDPSPGPHNIIEALAANTAALRDPNTAGKDQAVALCWVLHLCGDIHQPLHAIELFSPQFPNGDQGGNAILILRDPPYPDSQIKLHALWDQLPGTYKSDGAIRDLATGLRADPRYSREALKDSLAITDPAKWAQESHELAIQYAYLNGNLRGASATAPNTGGANSPNAAAQIPGLPPGYLKQAEDIAMLRIVLAGYRTADLLNGLAK